MYVYRERRIVQGAYAANKANKWRVTRIEERERGGERECVYMSGYK